MAGICKHSGCALARGKTRITGASCPECGFALHPVSSPLPYLVLPAFFAGLLLLLIPLCSPASLKIEQPKRVPSPSRIERPKSRVSADSSPTTPIRKPTTQASGNLLVRAEQLADSIDSKSIKSATSLAQALARRGSAQELKDPELLAAVVYCWVAQNISYDVASLDPTSRKPQDPDKVLQSGKAVCEGYACLCEFLLNQNQVEARIVHGLARTSDHRTGSPLSMQADGHAWLVAKWDGKWHILEPTWGAGFVSHDGYNASYSWDWFDCDPAVAIYSHIPEDAQMQLLGAPIATVDVERAAWLTFGFFSKFDVAPQPLLSGVISQGSDAIVLGWKVRPGCSIAADAISDRGAGPGKFSAQIFTLPSGFCELRFPDLPPGAYSLRIFAGTADDSKLEHCGTFLLDQTGSSKARRPPITFRSYQNLGAQLIEPLHADLLSGKWQRFAIRANPGLTFALKFEGENTVHYLSDNKGVYENQLLLRSGKLLIWQVLNGKMDGIVEFEVK